MATHSPSRSPERTAGTLAVRQEDNVGLTLESAKDTMDANMLIRDLQRHNAALRAEIDEARDGAEAAEARLAVSRKRVEQQTLDEAALVQALMSLNERIAISHEGLQREQDLLRAAEKQHSAMVRSVDELTAQVAAAKKSTQEARRDLEIAKLDRERIAEERRQAATARRAKIAETQRLRARLRHAEAQRLRGDLKSAALQRDIKCATDAVAKARSGMERPPFRSAVAVRSASR